MNLNNTIKYSRQYQNTNIRQNMTYSNMNTRLQVYEYIYVRVL